MIKTLIKHKLAELAINNLFDEVMINFQLSNLPPIIVGEVYKSIYIYNEQTQTKEVIYDVIVRDIRVAYGNECYNIHFNYQPHEDGVYTRKGFLQHFEMIEVIR